MTNITISGANGKMGRVISSCIADRTDCRCISGIDINTVPYSDFIIYPSASALPESPDVIIDYSHPSTLEGLLEYGLKTGTPLVLATTGYNDSHITAIKKTSEQIPVFFTFNMSLGINLLAQLARKAAEVLGGQFDIEIIEKHHNQKIDAPSGTAIMLADAINSTMGNTLHCVYDRHSQLKKRDKSEIGMHAVRGGTIVGEHEIIFAGRDEVISLSHSATSKEVFAVGSLNAALYLKNKPAGLYDMKALVEEG